MFWSHKRKSSLCGRLLNPCIVVVFKKCARLYFVLKKESLIHNISQRLFFVFRLQPWVKDLLSAKHMLADKLHRHGSVWPRNNSPLKTAGLGYSNEDLFMALLTFFLFAVAYWLIGRPIRQIVGKLADNKATASVWSCQETARWWSA